MAIRFPSRSKTPAVVTSGTLLLADFVTAMNNLVTAETAKYMAKRSERETVESIKNAATQSQAYSNPNDIAAAVQADLVKSSLNAHLQKAQSEQIHSFTYQQLAEMEIKAKQNYVGRKVRVTITDRSFKPVESYWLDSNSGQYRQGVISSKSVKGIIDEINFSKNLLVLKPTFGASLIVPQRKYFAVYPINPETLQPAVELSLI